jgi:hypothetical protein
MKPHTLAACLLASAFAVSPLAIAAPGGQTLNLKYKTSLAVVNLGTEANGVEYSLSANSYDDMDGVPQGSIFASRFGFDPTVGYFVYAFIRCTGPAFANIVTVNKTNGASSVNAVLDPANPSCYAFNSLAVTVAISGVASGGYARSDTGTTTLQYVGSLEKASYQSDSFEQSATGTNGYYSGSYVGNAEIAKITQRVRVR